MIDKKIWIFILCIAFGCVDIIQLDLPDRPSGRLVMEGFVERGEDYLIKGTVTRTQDLSENLEIIRVPAEIVLLVNDQHALTLVNGEQQRVPVEQFHQNYGGSLETARFKLRISVDEKLYESSNELILDVPKGASLGINLTEKSILNELENIVQKKFIELSVSTSLLNSVDQKTSLIWHISGAYSFPVIGCQVPPGVPSICYITDNIMLNSVSVLNAEEVFGDTITNFMINEQEANYKYYQDYYYTAVQKSLNRNAVRYWQKVASSLEAGGTIFDIPENKIVGNIKNVDDPDEEVLGYFYTSAVDTLRLLTTPEETGNQTYFCARFLNSPNYPEECCRCLSWPNSTDQKPSYWE